MYKIKLDAIPMLLNRLAEKNTVYVPAQPEEEGAVNFAAWNGGDMRVDLCTLKTALSPKHFFFSWVEELYKVERATSSENTCTYAIQAAPPPNRPFILFGVRACDVAGVAMLDKIFCDEPADAQYSARRAAACVISLACEAPGATCFCSGFGVDYSVPGGDVRTWLADGFLHWLPLSEKGKRLTEGVREDFSLTDRARKTAKRAPDAPQATIDAYIARIGGAGKEITSADALALFHSGAWDAAHHACVACGTCAFLCPTCHCYDIVHEGEPGGAVYCRRQWDTCLNASFTQMAHGNPRPSKKERFRQRFMHKLVYFPQKYGVLGCVGCGRCVARCPANVNILQVAKALSAEGGA